MAEGREPDASDSTTAPKSPLFPPPSLTPILSSLYLGNYWSTFDAICPEMLHVTAVLSVSDGKPGHLPPRFPGNRHLYIQCQDRSTTDILQYMEPVCDWIDLQLKRFGVEEASEDVPSADTVAPLPENIVLIHYTYGVSRSATMIIAYLMQRYQWQRDVALAYVRTKTGRVKPNRGFLEQLELWAAIKYRIWEEGRDQEGEGTRNVPKGEYASYLERRAAALKAKGLTGFETDIPENL